ncbi:MAG: TetR/AcrR family transcriptional regulator [Opitutaceae bacterium]|nr:TetR/AcrR family transcriptional regulator [Opitutaceae bacterium]
MTKKRKVSNQELRTRKDLLVAAGRLMKQGRKPTMEEVAAEAMVSRATAYRYFQSVEALLVESPVDAAVGDLGQLFKDNPSEDAEARIDEAEAFMHRIVYENEAQLRIVLANSISRDVADTSLPKRQNRRLPLIESALATARARFRDEDYDKLCYSLSLIFGPEAMIVFKDVLGIDEPTARQVKSWAVRALVRGALQPLKSRAKS